MQPDADGRWPADVPSSAHVFVESAAGLVDAIDVGGEDGHHLARVLRLRPEEAVTVADGSGSWRPYRVVDVEGHATGAGVRLAATGGLRREPTLSPGLGVAFALTKGHKPELVVQKLTELGADRILPVVAERSVVRFDGARAAAAVQRWRRIVREAARQCRRATLPAVADVGPLRGLAGHPGVVVAQRGGRAPETLAFPPGGEILVVVGPEGGLTAGERDALGSWARVDLGPHVLRAETAAIAAAAVFGARRSRHPSGSGGSARG